MSLDYFAYRVTGCLNALGKGIVVIALLVALTLLVMQSNCGLRIEVIHVPP